MTSEISKGSVNSLPLKHPKRCHSEPAFCLRPEGTLAAGEESQGFVGVSRLPSQVANEVISNLKSQTLPIATKTSRGARRAPRVLTFPAGGPLFTRMFTRLGCSGRPPQFVVEFYPYAGLVQTIRLRDEVAFVRFSDLMQSAPPRVLEAAAAILLAKLYRRRVPHDLRDLYREYSLAHHVRRRVHHLRRRRARRAILPPAGACHHLDPLFDQLNRDYFDGSLRRPQLGWSARPWRKQLGCFDPALDQIVLSSRLDRPAVPRYVVEYVLYHEMLHVKHPVRRASTRASAISDLKSQISQRASRISDSQSHMLSTSPARSPHDRRGCGLEIHSPAFRAEERRFAHFPAARRWLRRYS